MSGYIYRSAILHSKLLLFRRDKQYYESQLFKLKMRRFLEELSSRIVRNTDRSKKSLFVDCGSNLGQGYDFFSPWFPLTHFDHVLIEPNPHCVKILKEKLSGMAEAGSIRLIPKAASVYEGITKLFGLVEDARGAVSKGASIVDFHNTALYRVNEEAAIEVATFSFSDFISESHNKYPNIVVKMDIEGAEYAVLSDLIEKNTAGLIKALFVEYHSNYMEPKSKTEYMNIESRFTVNLKHLGCEVYMWR